MGIITTIGWAIIAFVLFMGIRIIMLAIKNERNRKFYMATMKVGDKVYTPTDLNTIHGEVLEINDGVVTMKVVAPIDRVYPQKDKLSNTDKLIGAFKNRKQ